MCLLRLGGDNRVFIYVMSLCALCGALCLTLIIYLLQPVSLICLAIGWIDRQENSRQETFIFIGYLHGHKLDPNVVFPPHPAHLPACSVGANVSGCTWLLMVAPHIFSWDGWWHIRCFVAICFCFLLIDSCLDSLWFLICNKCIEKLLQ